MSLHSLAKLSIRVLQVNSSWNCELKNTSKCLSCLLQNETDSDKNLVHIFLTKFFITWCKRFPPHLNSLCTILQNVAFVFCRYMAMKRCWVHCFKFEVIYTLEILWFKKKNSVLIFTILITTRCEKVIFWCDKNILVCLFSIHSWNNCCSLTKCESWISQGSVETLFK